MKKFTILGLLVVAIQLISITKSIGQTCPTLVWSDEFNGTTLSATNWNTYVGNGCAESLCSFGNNELQSYQAANLTISGGTLKILAKQENINDRNYSSGKITSKDLAKFTYGRYEARIKLPKGDGLWPAFWMLSNNEPYGTWPQSGEIDIMEYVATNNDETLGYIHYGALYPNNKNQGKKYKVSNTNLSDDFHVFAIEWEPNIIRWYIDGVLFSTKTNTDVSPSPWPFDQDMYMILNVAVGGNLGGAVVNSMLPATMEVDYVRVYGGNKPYLVGDNVVANAAQGKIYTLSQTASGATINWSVPAGSTIVSGQGTSNITVNFGTSNGNLVATYNDNCNTNYALTMPIKIQNAATKCATFENFDEVGTVTKNTLTTGVLTEVTNPGSNSVNNSALVGKYDRKGSEQYDVLFYDVTSVTNGNDYKTGTKKFSMDVYTSAPIGSEIYLQLETAASAPDNYPTGRHSRYIATVAQNGVWHRLEFSLLDAPDAGASPTAITKMVILFKPNTFTSDTYYFDNLDSYCSAVVPPALVKCSSFENFDEAGTVTKNTLTTGVLTEVANPGSNSVNSSALVGKYDRKGSEQYDVLFYDVTSVANGNDYKNGTKKFYMDVYTSAPIGTEIYLQLETAASASTNYPTGRHSRYIATVAQNAVWHRLEFSLLDAPDAGASPTAITKMVILFKPNTFTSDTYYFDNLDSYCSGVVPPTMAKCSSFENFDDIATISEVFKTGVLTEITNPLPADPINSTTKVGKYDRAGGSQYDVLIYNVSTIANGDDYKNGVKKFYMDVYTQAPIGTEILLQLETSAASDDYPAGRHSRYKAVITDNSKWKRLEFVYLDQPDPAATATDIKKMIVLFKPNTYTADTYYFDNLDSYCTPEPPTLVKCGALENFDEAGAITFNATTTGVLTEEANPMPINPLNTTALVGKYVRAASAAYDVLFYDVTTITNADEYIDGTKKFFMDVKTAAPIGTEIIIQLESAAATGANYPTGRHSRYHAFTTSNTDWQRLEFDYIDSPGGTVDPATITKMVILFMPGQNTGDTYYFDNLDTYCLSPVSSNVVSGTILEDSNGGTIDGTPLSVGGTYISIFKSSNTSSTPDATVPVASGTGAYTFPALPTGKYKLVYTTNPAGSTTPSFPNIGGFSMKAGAEGEAGTMGDGNPDGITFIEISVGSTIYSGAKVAAPAGVSFALAQNAPLPVRLISFNGKNVEEGNQLSWKVSAEQNFSHYEIERSAAAKTFKTIGKVMGNSNVNELLSYSYIDKNEELNKVGLAANGAYYRLKMVDLDGKTEFSKIIFVENKTEKSTVGNFYPNPSFGNEVHININSSTQSKWTITGYDLAGRVLSSENRLLEKGDNKVSINIKQVFLNMVIYRFENAEEIQYRKLIK
jgi:beta-glucanase (GH16 family)